MILKSTDEISYIVPANMKSSMCMAILALSSLPMLYQQKTILSCRIDSCDDLH